MYNIKKYLNLLSVNHPSFFSPIKDNGIYNWRQLLDENDGMLDRTNLKNLFPEESIGFNMWLTGHTKKPKNMDSQISKYLNLHDILLSAVKEISKLALLDKDNKYEFSNFIRNLIFYGIEDNEMKNGIGQSIIRNKKEVMLGRLDVLANGLISEFQLASGGWSSMIRLHQIFASHKNLVREFFSIFQEATGKDTPNIAFLVTEGVAQYFFDLGDLATVFNGMFDEKVAFVTGADGLINKNDDIFYQRNNGKLVKIDIVYSIGDVRRIVDEGAKHLLRAVFANKVKLQPTINPLLNNYQLALSLLNETLTYKWFQYYLGVNLYEQIKSIYVNYYLIHKENTICLNINNKQFPINLSRLLTSMGSSQRRDYVLRKVLTENLRDISGGWGIKRFSDLNTKAKRDELVKASDFYYHYIKEHGGKKLLYKELFALAPYYQSTIDKTIEIYKQGLDKIEAKSLENPLTIYQYYLIRRNNKFEIFGKHAFYSDKKTSGIHIGGDTRTIGYLK